MKGILTICVPRKELCLNLIKDIKKGIERSQKRHWVVSEANYFKYKRVIEN